MDRSSLTIHSGDPAVRPQIELARATFEAGVPSFGSCWAAQIAVVAAGGRCAANPRGREMGIARKIVLTGDGRSHPLYIGKPRVFDAFISHEDEITHLPPGALNLAGNAFLPRAGGMRDPQGRRVLGGAVPPGIRPARAGPADLRPDGPARCDGFFAGAEAAHDYVNKLETLHQDPSRRDLAWLLGIDDDVMNEDVRRVEVRNWINHLVLPRMRA